MNVCMYDERAEIVGEEKEDGGGTRRWKRRRRRRRRRTTIRGGHGVWFVGGEASNRGGESRLSKFTTPSSLSVVVGRRSAINAGRTLTTARWMDSRFPPLCRSTQRRIAFYGVFRRLHRCRRRPPVWELLLAAVISRNYCCCYFSHFVSWFYIWEIDIFWLVHIAMLRALCFYAIDMVHALIHSATHSYTSLSGQRA